MLMLFPKDIEAAHPRRDYFKENNLKKWLKDIKKYITHLWERHCLRVNLRGLNH
tara:strand:+ start:142 stop:303 length:162 start_codon:yes stop_codon:yes gene_type:complete